MKVVSSFTKDGRSVAVEVDQSDMTFPKNADGSIAYNQNKCHQQMMMFADMLIVRYLIEAEIVSNEYGQARIREIQSRPTRCQV